MRVPVGSCPAEYVAVLLACDELGFDAEETHFWSRRTLHHFLEYYWDYTGTPWSTATKPGLLASVESLSP